MSVPGFVLYPLGILGVTVASAAYIWFRRPAIAVRLIFKLAFYMCGLRPRFVKGKTYTYCFGERGFAQPDKSSLLFIHGFSASKDQWVPIVQKLPKSLHVVALDLPGHGESSIPGPDDKIYFMNMVQYVHEFVEAVGLDRKPFHLIGTSMGGAICGCYGADYPSHVARLTVICPMLRTPVKTEFMKELDDGHCRLLPETAEELKFMLNSCVYHQLHASHQFFEGAIQLRRLKNEFYRRLFLTLLHDKEGEEEALQKLSEIKVPIQVIWGKHDEIIHISGLDTIKEKVPRLDTVEVYERCGHSVAIDRPGQLTKSILQFRGEYEKKTKKS